jgi:hypothetical protein
MLKSVSDWQNMLHVWETEEYHTGFWWETPRERDHLEYLGEDGRIKKNKWPFNKQDGRGGKI